MPIQRRLPKFGFTSRMGRRYAEVRLHELAKIEDGTINPDSLIAAGIVPLQTETVKIILSGSIDKAVNGQWLPGHQGCPPGHRGRWRLDRGRVRRLRHIRANQVAQHG